MVLTAFKHNVNLHNQEYAPACVCASPSQEFESGKSYAPGAFFIMEKTCLVCGKVYRVKPSEAPRRSTCSKSCAGKLLVGSKNPNFRALAPKVCNVCGKNYRSYDKRRKYCSASCASKTPESLARLVKMASMKRKKGIRRPKKFSRIKYRQCEECNSFFVLPIKIKRRYCYQCYGTPKPYFDCIICGVTFKHINKKVTCSKKCLTRHRSNIQKGQQSHRWEGGKTSAAMKLRNSLEYKEWRQKVFERDDFTCQVCGVRGHKLNADHIKPFCLFPDLIFDVNNGRTLCKPCHLKTPTWGYKAAHMKSAMENLERKGLQGRND